MAISKIWNGSSWVTTSKAKFASWSGSAWATPSNVKVWNGSAWQTIFPVAFRADSFANANNVSSINGTIPASVQTGDLLVLIVGQTSFSTTLFNAISGWTKQVEQRAGGAAMTIAVYTRLAQAGDAGSTVTASSINTENMTIQIRAYSNVDQTTPLDASIVTGQVDPAATTASAPAITVVNPGAMLVTVFAIPTSVGTTVDGTSFTDPTGFSNELVSCTNNTTNNAAIATYDETTPGTGSQGPFAATCTQSRRWALATIAVRPA